MSDSESGAVKALRILVEARDLHDKICAMEPGQRQIEALARFQSLIAQGWDAARAVLALIDAPPKLDDSRCAVCGWPLSKERKSGCVRGDCSLRPTPDRRYDPTRADREASA